MTADLNEARARWSGTTAVITGAGSGLGAGFAEVAAEIGMSVVLADVDPDRLGETARRVEGAGATALALRTDVSRYGEVENLAARVFDGPVHLGLLINNAGVEHVGLLWEEPPESWHRVVGVNLNGVYHGVRAFLPRMLADGRPGTVLNIASVAALTTGAYHGVYEVTKHGVLALSEALADGLAAAGAGVQVSVALPGPVRTRIYRDANAQVAPGSANAGHVEAMRRMLDEGMTPVVAARTMLARVAAGDFAVTTHPEMLRALAAQRSARLAQLGEGA